MSKVLVIGCGGVASVAISKCCQVSDVFTELCIASRTKSKCDALAAKLAPNTKTKITTAQVDADAEPALRGACNELADYLSRAVNGAFAYQPNAWIDWLMLAILSSLAASLVRVSLTSCRSCAMELVQ